MRRILAALFLALGLQVVAPVLESFAPEPILQLVDQVAEAAPTYIAAGTPVEDTGATISVAVPLYAGAATGHAMFVHLMFAGDNNGETTFDVAGFELIENEESTNASNLIRSQLWCKIHDGSEANPTLSIASTDTGDVVAAFSFGFSGTHTSCTDIIGDTNEVDTTGTADIPTPGLTSTTANAAILACGVKGTASATPGVATLDTDSLAWVEIAEYDTASGGDVMGACDYFLDDATPNTISTDTFVVDTPAASTARTAAIMVSIKPEAVAANPDWDTPPSVSAQSDTAYTISYDANADADDIFCGLYAKDATPPADGAAVEAGASDRVLATEAVTGASDSIDLTAPESPPWYIGDIYCVLKADTGEYSAIVDGDLLDEVLDIPSGKQRLTLTSVDATSPYFGQGVATGDTPTIDTATDPDAFVVTDEVDGTVSYAAGGSTARQIIDSYVYDVSNPANLLFTLVYNNLTCGLEDDLLDDDPQLFQKNVAISAQESETLCVDPEGDAVDVAVDALPTGLSLVDTPPWQVTGTPTTCSEVTSEFTWTDAYGATYVESIVYQIGDLVPDVVTGGVDEATAIAAIEAVCSFTATAGTPAYSATVALGDVISTDPVNGWLSPPDQEVTYSLSLGPPPPGGGMYDFNDFGVH